jgi:protein-tyrosine phosphatase
LRSVLFVCTANICRSPTAVGVLRKFLAQRGMEDKFEVESAGTHDYHVGKPPFPTAVEVGKSHGYDITQHIARRIKGNDFDHFDLILAMDKSNLKSLRAISPTRSKQKIELLLEYGDEYHGLEVPDPYGGKREDFERAYAMIKDGCKGLVQLLVR